MVQTTSAELRIVPLATVKLLKSLLVGCLSVAIACWKLCQTDPLRILDPSGENYFLNHLVDKCICIANS